METTLRTRMRSSLPPQDAEHGFLQSWFPIAKSADVGVGEVISRRFLDGKVVVFRGRSGVASVVSPYCRHLGADLAVGGEVKGEHLRCPYHHWLYGQDGRCTAVPFNETPKDASLFKFPTIEAYGLIWAFNGEEPLFEFPGIPGYEEDDLIYRIAELGTFPVEPWVMTTNSFDVAHLKAVHRIKVTDCEDDGMKEDTYSVSIEMGIIDEKYGPSRVAITIHGTNIAFIPTASEDGSISLTLNAKTPIGGGVVQYYLISAVPRQSPTNASEEQLQEQLAGIEDFLIRLLSEDRPIMENIRFADDTLVHDDRFIKRYLDWVKTFPRAHPSLDYIT